jgi:endonuclease-3
MPLNLRPRIDVTGRTKETVQVRRRRLARILGKLEKAIPVAKVELDHRSPLELLVATILSAQCTDQRVNQVTPELFRRYPGAKDYAGAQVAELEALIRSTGFYRSKARSLIACGKALSEHFGGQVPETIEELVSLPGIGRKTANVILGNCFGKPAIVVDTHVKRVAGRLALTTSADPVMIEQHLQHLMPPERWTAGSQRLLLHGRYVCLARWPRCEKCPISADCPSVGKWPTPSKA